MSRPRTTATDLVKLLDDSSAPVYVLDEERRIVFCNAACARWTSTKPAELVGQQCAYHAPDDEAGPCVLAAGLCPPPKVFSGHSQQSLVSCRGSDGRVVYRRAQFWPLGDGQDDSAAVIAVLESADCSADAQCSAPVADAQLHSELVRFRRQMADRFPVESLLGNSPAIVRARAQIELAGASDANVLIIGPKGSGKDHVARAIHYRRDVRGPLVPLACAVLESCLLLSTLRALASRNSGATGSTATVLLDDVDCIPPEVQTELAELLRSPAAPRMRVIAIATRPLANRGAQEPFSHDLACTLSTITIELPPLSQRLEDLPLLAQALLEESNARGTKQVGGFSPEALDRLVAYTWPGNVDELAATVRESHERARGGEVGVKDLPPQIHLAADAAARPARRDEAIVLEEFLARVEKELIARAMHRAKGNKSKAARLLGLTRPRLYRRLVQLGFEKGEGKARCLMASG